MTALVPAATVAPAASRQARQPAGPPTRGLPERPRRAVQGVVALMAAIPTVDPGPAARPHGRVVTAPPAMDRAPVGPPGKGRAPVRVGVARERPFASAAGPRPPAAQGDHLTPAERGPRTWIHLRRQRGLAPRVNHDGQRGQEGIRVDPGTTPLQTGIAAVLSSLDAFR